MDEFKMTKLLNPLCPSPPLNTNLSLMIPSLLVAAGPTRIAEIPGSKPLAKSIPGRKRTWRAKQQRERSDRGAMVLLGGLLVLLLSLVIVAWSFGRVVPPGCIGVRQILFGLGIGPKAGFSERGLRPGFHWRVPGYSAVHLLPHQVQILSIHREAGGALEVKTADGAVVDVDVTVFYRLFAEPGAGSEGAHGGPADLVRSLSLQPNRWQNHVRTVTTGQLRSSLSRLQGNAFYDPEERLRVTEEAKVAIARELAPLGIQVEEVLVRRYTYRSESINEAIFRKNMQDQEEKLNSMRSSIAEVRAQLEQVAAEWDAKTEVLRTTGENDAAVIRSEAALYENEKRSLGDLEITKAKAESDRLKAQALDGAEGTVNYVARELAPLAASLKGGVLSGINPYDIDGWLKKFGVSPSSQPKSNGDSH